MPTDTIDLRNLHILAEDRKLTERPVRGLVSLTQPETETMKVESWGKPGTDTVAVRHPYVGTNSWLRCMPEPGTTVVTQHIMEPNQIEVWGYVSHRLGDMVRRYKDEQALLYRQLQPGEIEIMSAGRAYQHFSEDGNLTFMAGTVEQYLQQTEHEWLSRAPTQRRQLDQQEPTALAHEERFGLVKRHDTQKPNAVQVYMKDGTNFQYEYGRWINDDEGNSVTTLHEGHLFDSSQQQIKNSKTNRRVRLRRTVEHRKNNSTFTFDVDEDLNIVLTNTTSSKTTADLDFGVKSEVKITSKKFDLNILQSSNQTFTLSATMKAPKLRFNSVDVGFGAAPIQPAVLGSMLTANVLAPMLSIMQSGYSVLVADTSLSEATRNTLKNLVDGMGGVQSAFSSILSTEVKLTK